MNIKIDIDVDKITERKAGSDARHFLCSTFIRYMDKYIPKKSHQLASNIDVENDGREIVLNAPYAHYIREGELLTDEKGRTYVGKGEKKGVHTGKPLTFHNGGVARFDEVAKQNHMDDITESLKAYIRGR